MRGQVTSAGKVNAGDAVLHDGAYVVIERVRRAQGRKPASGENLHLVTASGEVVKINSAQPIRVIRAAHESD